MVRATTIFRYRFKTIKADATLMPIAHVNELVSFNQRICMLLQVGVSIKETETQVVAKEFEANIVSEYRV